MNFADQETMKRAATLAQAGERATAYAIFQQLRQTNPNDLNVLLWLAFTSSDLNEARQMVEEASRLDRFSPSVDNARKWLAQQTQYQQSGWPTPIAGSYPPPIPIPVPGFGAGAGYPPPTAGRTKPLLPTWAYVLMFIFATPVWVILMFVDKKVSKGAKVSAGIVAALIMLFYVALIAFVIADEVGPEDIKFGSSYQINRYGSYSLLNEHTTFNRGDAYAWLVKFDERLDVYSLNVVWYRKLSNEQEVEVERYPATVQPTTNTLYDDDVVDPSFEPGRYVVKVFKRGEVIASGELTIR